MTNYYDYDVEDFVSDDFFLSWALDKSEDSTLFWENWILQYPEREYIVNQALEIIHSIQIAPVRDLSPGEIDQIISRVKERNTASNRFVDRIIPIHVHKKQLLRIAAILIPALLSIGFILYSYYASGDKVADTRQILAKQAVGFVEKLNNTKHAMLILLADNSTVILKPGARLKFPTKFLLDRREVFLEGEGFFEISKNPDKPFLVYSNNLITKVLGTSFTVNSSVINNKFEVIVNTGKVEVFSRDGQLDGLDPEEDEHNKVLLMPNQKVSYDTNTDQLVKSSLKKPSILSKEVAQKVFAFDDAPLSKIISAINDAYNINIKYNEKNLANCSLTATLGDQPIYEKIELLCKALNAHYTIVNGEIMIDGDGCSN